MNRERLGYGLDDWGIDIRFPAVTSYFCLLHTNHTVSGTHPVFTGDKVVEV
jgi:hypothetical protein